MTDPAFAPNIPPHYYAVIFASRRTPGNNGYAAMAERMASLTATQSGVLGIETAQGERAYSGPTGQLHPTTWTAP